MNPQHYFIYTGGQPGNPNDGPKAEAIPLLDTPTPLPRAAQITFWWGLRRFKMIAFACSIRTTPWGTGQMTWLHCKAVNTVDIKPDAPMESTMYLVPARYVTDVKSGQTFQTTIRRACDDIALFPPSQPTPPHALSLGQIQRALAGLSDLATPPWSFSISYPVFALQRESGDFASYGTHGEQPTPGELGIPVLTTKARATALRRCVERRARIMSFDKVAVFRRFLRSIRDAGTCVLFDPVPGPNHAMYTDHAYPAAVVLEQFLPAIAWGLSFPVYVLRQVPLFATINGDHAGTPVKLLVVFTDTDLADRAVKADAKGWVPEAIANLEEFGHLLRTLSPDVAGVAFDPPRPEPGVVARNVMFREAILANLDDLEL